MKNINRKILITMCVMISIFMSSATVLAEIDATIDIDPEIPKRKDTISFTADITTDETIQTVTLKVQECNVQVCFSPDIVTMDKIGDTYTGEVTLSRSDTIYIQYWLEIETDMQTNETEIIKVDLDTSSTNGDTNRDSDSNGSPGFELIIVIIAIFIGVVLLNRKRSR